MMQFDYYVRTPKVYESYLYYEKMLKSIDNLVAFLAWYKLEDVDGCIILRKNKSMNLNWEKDADGCIILRKKKSMNLNWKNLYIL